MRWRFSGAQWAALSAELGVERYPAPLRITTVIRTEAARARIRDELATAGLLQHGRVDAGLEATLRRLQRPTVWLDSMWVDDSAHAEPVRLLAGHDGGNTAACAVQRPGERGATSVQLVPLTGLVGAVIAALPAERAGTRPAVMVDDRDEQRQQSVLVAGSPTQAHPQSARTAAAAILDEQHPRGGQIAANVRTRSGQVRRSALLRWYDNHGDGRYQASLTPDGVLDVRPADAQRLGHTAQHLLTALTG